MGSKKYGIVNNEIFLFATIVFFGSIPLFFFSGWLNYRAYKYQEVIKSNFTLINKFHIEHWAHIMSLLQSDTENRNNKNIDEALKNQLIIAYSKKYERSLRTKLHKLFSKKTAPQIEEILAEFLE